MKTIYPDELIEKNWTFSIGAEQASTNWINTLDSQNVECLISPLHDSDIGGTKTILPPHYHIVLFSLTRKQAQEISNIVKGTTVIPIRNTRKVCRYLCNLDSSESPQYPTENVIALGGIAYADCISKDAFSEERE